MSAQKPTQEPEDSLTSSSLDPIPSRSPPRHPTSSSPCGEKTFTDLLSMVMMLPAPSTATSSTEHTAPPPPSPPPPPAPAPPAPSGAATADTEPLFRTPSMLDTSLLSLSTSWTQKRAPASFATTSRSPSNSCTPTRRLISALACVARHVSRHGETLVLFAGQSSLCK